MYSFLCDFVIFTLHSKNVAVKYSFVARKLVTASCEKVWWKIFLRYCRAIFDDVRDRCAIKIAHILLRFF